MFTLYAESSISVSDGPSETSSSPSPAAKVIQVKNSFLNHAAKPRISSIEESFLIIMSSGMAFKASY
jgi:hypothetical protein